MDTETARSLINLNSRFYAHHAATFSATRSAPWEGWQRVADVVSDRLDGSPDSLSILDLACGNLRFERFLAERLPHAAIRVTAVDNCPALAADTAELARVDYRNVDVLTLLLADKREGTGQNAVGERGAASKSNVANMSGAVSKPRATKPDENALAAAFPRAACDLAVCFGFMHHVPDSSLRLAVLSRLIDSVRPGGIVAVSFWQFMNDERLARKAARSLEIALSRPPFEGFAPESFEEGDHFLGWQADDAAFRYCHHFTTEEIDHLASLVSSAAHPVAAFSADGSNRSLNRYLVLQRTA